MSVKKIIISVIAILNVLFMPIYDVWGGLFPGVPDDNFIDVIEYVFEGEFDYWVVIFTMSIFVPSVLMLIASFSKENKLYSIFAGLGIGLVLLNLIRYLTQQELYDVFDFADCNISIGLWTALIIFIAALILCAKPEKKKYDYVRQTEPNPGPAAAPQKHYCRNCGTELGVNIAFCGICGTKQ